MRAGLVVVLWLVAVSARAQVAVAVTLPDNNPTHRDVAAGLVDAVDDRWSMLSPQLNPTDVAQCKTEFGCLQGISLARGASHLLVIGIAGLGTRDYVVSFQLYDSRGTKLVDENTVETASVRPTDDGAGLAAKLLLVPGMPQLAPAPVVVAPVVPPGPSTLAVTGMALVAGGGVVGIGTAIAALGLAVEPASASERDGIVTGAVFGTTLAVLLGAAGAACVVVDTVD